MKKIQMNAAILFFSFILLLSGCAGQQGANENDHNSDHKENLSVYDTNASTKNLDDPLVIPSEHGEKRQTTDEHGGTTHGTGSTVYSLIGSSGLHDGGISAHLESRLSGEGIDGIEVFVLDDTIILARGSAQTTSNQYDSVQNQVLTGTNGMSGKGEDKGTSNNNEATDDNLDKAKSYMNKAFNGNVQILTVTNPKAVDLIDRIKTNLKSSSVPYKAISNDISTLVQMTAEK
ncbi:hypothetical protein [Fredinandcohnia quinoae]|uniref:Uncharacterized protein n=1 Tax=Fredinandcohnia quinoae TaxID=2918902 RepID=A0AAW5E197_9BACI|nr:hypothetical protein [Fredinandcohnia sp. SECRCQ15]MCH1626687.1 hypothetical protein [Fredinandcohnia sp. SECRCQ15]